jgi:hypothetical protein
MPHRHRRSNDGSPPPARPGSQGAERLLWAGGRRPAWASGDGGEAGRDHLLGERGYGRVAAHVDGADRRLRRQGRLAVSVLTPTG